jgi:hypothetical protein
MKAMAEGQKQNVEHRTLNAEVEANMRPVQTPLNNQVREHQRQVTIKALKRAAGAESMTAALDMDFSLLSTKKPESRKLGLFND